MTDLKIDTDAIVTASCGFQTISDDTGDILSGLLGDLGQSAQMAGGDPAGQVFAQYYLSAAQATAMALHTPSTVCGSPVRTSWPAPFTTWRWRTRSRPGS